jgi:hypothetical protein
VSSEIAGELVSLFGVELTPLTILALVLLAISGAFQQIFLPVAPARPSTIRLGAPRLVAMSDAEAADAAHLLGSSVAALMAAVEEDE